MGDPFQETLARARSGDDAAYATIFRDVQPRLLRYLKVLDADAAEDAAAETWYEVAAHLGAFRGDESGFRAWVLTIGRRKVVDRARADSRRPVQLVPADDAGVLEGLEGSGTAPDPAVVAEQEEATQRALALVRTLPPEQAEVLVLRIVAGLDNGQVAAMLGKTPGAVRVLAHRGLRRLARTLSPEPAVTLGSPADDEA